MDEKMQEITMIIYPEFSPPKEWHLSACVYGEWAVHETMGGETYLQRRGLEWVVSHVPTGAIAYVAKQKDAAIKAAWRLSQLEPPESRVIVEEGEEPRMHQPSLEWIRIANERLTGIEVFACVGRQLIAPANVYQRYLAARHLKKMKAQQPCPPTP